MLTIRILGLLLVFSGVSAMTLDEARDSYTQRDYSGAALDGVKRAQQAFKQHLGELTEVDVHAIRLQERDKLKDEGYRRAKDYLVLLDNRIQERLQSTIDRLQPEVMNNLTEIHEYAEMTSFIADAIETTEETAEEKAAIYLQCFNATDLATRAFGIYDLQNMQDHADIQKDLLSRLTRMDADQLSQLADILYMRASCIGSWGLAWGTLSIRNKMEGGRRVPEIQANCKILTSLNLKTMVDMGPYRILGRVASRAPSERFGKDLAKGRAFLKEAFMQTRNGGVVSINGFNNTYYADAMKSFADQLSKDGRKNVSQGERKVTQGEQMVADGQAEAGDALIAEGQELIAEGKLKLGQGQLQEYKAIKLLKLMLEENPQTLNPNYIPENKRAFNDARILLQEWQVAR